MKPRPDATVILDDAEIGGYTFESIEIQVWIADQGIGPYEFWGMKGNDRRMGIDDYRIIEAVIHPEQEDPPKDLEDFLDTHEDELLELVEDSIGGYGYVED